VRVPVKYLGSKRALLPLVLRAIESVASRGTVLDLFSGTSRVGHALKARGYRVLANDHAAFAETFARCYVEADAERVRRDAETLLADLDRLPGSPGWFTDTYAVQSRYVQPRNAERVDAVREAIERRGLDPETKAVVLTALVEATDRVDSTTGVQMAYLKRWAPRSYRDLRLRVPEVLPRAASGKGEAHRLEAGDAALRLEGDVAYLDPPYNGHSYLGNYHVWESLVLWDKPETYGLARKRVDVRDRRSPFNHRLRAEGAFAEVVARVRARHLVVSFSDEGFLARDEVERLLSVRGEVRVLQTAHRRYVGSQIGIYNPRGEKVGVPGHRENTEYVFVVRDCVPAREATPTSAPPAPG
jgi:adenine-specific DNA-methyltransferase